MNTIAIQRIAWKEFRQQAVFFVALIAIAVPAGVLLAGLLGNMGSTPETASWPAMILGLFCALYAAACGATLYATEKEERTFQILQLLPLNARQLLIGKLSVAAFLGFGFCVAMLLGAWWLCGQETSAFSRIGWLKAWFLTFGLGAIEFFAWSLLFSLILKRPLVAATLGIAVASTTVQMILRAVTGSLFEPFELAPYVDAFWYRALIALVLLAVDFWIASRWLSGRALLSAKPKIRSRAATIDQAHVDNAGRSKQRPQTVRILGRFTWQAWRSSWPLMLTYIICLPLCLPFGISTNRIEVAMAILMFVSAVAGVFSFSSDKTSSGASFLAHHGERPALYWLANVTVWIGWIVLVNVLIGMVVMLVLSYREQESLIFTTHGLFALNAYNRPNELSSGMGQIFSFLLSATWLTAGMVLSFAAGHLCSILITRRVLAAIAAMAASIPVTIWFGLMLASETPLYWSALPLFVAFMTAGCIATRWWLGNRRTTTRIALLLGAILTLWTGLAFLVIQKRSIEIPIGVPDIADYRSSMGPPNRQILDEMRQRFSSALDGYESPEGLSASIYSIYSEVLDAVNEGKSGTPDEQISKSLRDELRELAIVFPGTTASQQIELASKHLAENRQRLDALADATQFAIEHGDELRKMEPAFFGKLLDSRQAEPPLPYSVDISASLLQLDYLDAVRQQDSRLAWQRLKARWLFKSAHNLIYARTGSNSYFQEWFAMKELHPDDIAEALNLVKQGWLEPVTYERELERNYLATMQSIQHTDVAIGPARMKYVERTKQFLFQVFPWEVQRSIRLINLWTAWQEMRYEAWQDNVNGKPFIPLEKRWLLKTGSDNTPSFADWVDNTILPSQIDGQNVNELRQQSLRRTHPWQNNNLRYPAIWAEQDAEVQTLILAAIAWQFEHGVMPNNLKQLEGTILDEIPKLVSIDSDGNRQMVPKYRLIRGGPGSGDCLIAPSEDFNSSFRWKWDRCRIPDVITGRTTVD